MEIGSHPIKAFKKLADTSNLDVVAVADCWKQRADEGAAQSGASHSLQDYRELLDLKEVDYVTIATPEHSHAAVALEALDAGKHVYCEKPLTHTIPEAIRLQEKTRSSGLALQVGIQGMSDDSYASAGEAIRNGVLGVVVQAQIEYVRHGIEHCIRGYRGTLIFTNEGWVAKDKDGKILAEHKKTGAEDVALHHANLLRHIRDGEPLNCPIEIGVAGVATACMANESWRSGRMMAWDTEKQDMVSAASLQ